MESGLGVGTNRAAKSRVEGFMGRNYLSKFLDSRFHRNDGWPEEHLSGSHLDYV
jgi:hypothetical protein